MRFFISKSFSLFLALSTTAMAQTGDDGAYLDPAIRDHRHPIVESEDQREFTRLDIFKPARKNDVLKVISNQSPVRSQMKRGTCSIFASTALLESMLVIKRDFDTNVDLSEEWLEYLVNRRSTSGGSTSIRNYNAFRNYGTAEEDLLPYIGETWETLNDGIARERCGRVPQELLKSCLIVHRDPRLLDQSDESLTSAESEFFDPEFQATRTRASVFRNEYLNNVGVNYYVSTVTEAKALLRRGIPINLDLDFYYGAWNHRVADELGINRDMSNWSKGIVGYPEAGSVDRTRSHEDPAGHSVLVVGYDDDLEITTTQRMNDGTMKEFTYKGVYYIKNSWGTGSFGTQTTIAGQVFPGYGIITQKYAHEFGSFYKLPLN